MKKIVLPMLLAVLIIAGCTKKTTNNYTTAIYALPAFTVNGVHDIAVRNGGSSSFVTYIDMPVTVQYTDSAQSPVTLSLSGLPSGIVVDTSWVKSGIPTFGTDIYFYDTTAAGATPGSYSLTLTATTSAGAQKTYPFTLKVLPVLPCIEFLLGRYNNCSTSCTSSSLYTDSVYADPTVVNRIWLVNFDNTAAKIYANYNCNTGQLTIPSQVIGTTTYSGSGNASSGGSSGHFMSFNVFSTTSTGGTNTCVTDMN